MPTRQAKACRVWLWIYRCHVGARSLHRRMLMQLVEVIAVGCIRLLRFSTAGFAGYIALGTLGKIDHYAGSKDKLQHFVVS